MRSPRCACDCVRWGAGCGLRQLIDDDRSCHQIDAVTAAAREVALIVLEAHLRTCRANAVEEHDGEAAIQEMVDVLPRTVRR